MKGNRKPTKPLNKNRIRLLLLAVAFLALLIFVVLLQTPLGQSLWTSFRDQIRSWPPWAFALFVGLAPLVGFPLSPCHVVAGGVYGFLTGTVVMVSGIALNITLSHLIASRLLRAPLTTFVTRRGWPVPTLGEIGQFRAIFLLRTVPGPPFWLQNYLIPLAGIPFWLNFTVSFPIAAIFAAGTVSVAALAISMPELIPWMLLALALVFATVRINLWLRQRRQTPL